MHNYVMRDATRNTFWELWSRVALYANSCVVFRRHISDSSIVYALSRPEIMQNTEKISHILKKR